MSQNTMHVMNDHQTLHHSAFGFEEMLTELEAIVAEAEIRLAEEEAA